jgi:phosphinothricin acetyltransferase
MENLTYKNALVTDLPAIVALYNSTIQSRMVTADTEPVSVQEKIAWFNQHSPQKRPLWIIENEKREIIGWVSFQDFYGRPAYAATAEVSIYLAAEQRGKGLGKQILQYCLDYSPRLGITNLLGFIFAHNKPSLQLFYNAGFEDWAHLPGVAVMDGEEYSLKIVGKRIGLRMKD